jgi:hypothetical protein
MPNHSSGKGKRKSYQQPSAEERYANLELAKQLACYRYLTHIEQGRNTKLWNPNKTPTSVWNWRSSNYIKEHIEEGSWAKVAKVSNDLLDVFDSIQFFLLIHSCVYLLTFVLFVCQVMATLAKELAARGKRLVDPLQAAAAKAKKTGLTFDDCEENFCFDREEEKEGSTTSPKKKAAIHTSGKFSSPSGNFSSQSARPVSRQEYLKSLDSSKKTALKSPPLTQQVTPRMDRLTQAANHLSLEDGSHVEIVGSAYATIIGTWDDQNVDEDDTDSSGSDDEFEDEVFTMIRMIMPNGITEKLLTPEWLDDQTLQLTIRWPTWFRKVSKHVALQKSETNAKFKFGKNHKVFRTMRRYVRNLYKRDPSTGLKVSPKVIEDTILFKFNSSMDTTADAIQVKVVKIAIGKDDIDAAAGEEIPTGGKVSVLQVIVSAKINEKNEVAKKIKVSGEEANLGKEPDGTKAFDVILV